MSRNREKDSSEVCVVWKGGRNDGEEEGSEREKGVK